MRIGIVVRTIPIVKAIKARYSQSMDRTTNDISLKIPRRICIL